MFVTLVFPITDLRRLVLPDNSMVMSPYWPDHFDLVDETSRDVIPFQRNLGAVIERPLGPLSGWVQENMICEIGRALSIDGLQKVRIRKRFYFDGTYLGYFSFSFGGLSKKIQGAMDYARLVETVNGLGRVTLSSRHAAGPSRLGAAQEMLAEVYGRGSAKGELVGVRETEWLPLVSVGSPIVIVELERTDFEALRPPSGITFQGRDVALFRETYSEFSEVPTLLVSKIFRDDNLSPRAGAPYRCTPVLRGQVPSRLSALPAFESLQDPD